MAQIGTIKLQTQNSGVVDVPVFDTGDSGSGIYEFVRVETTSGTGFIPTTDPADATYPFLRVQSQNQGVVALTDTENAIPDSAVSQYDATKISGSDGNAITSWADQLASNDLSGNGSYKTNIINNNAVVRHDGTDDEFSNTNIFESQPYTISGVFEWDSVGQFETIWTVADGTSAVYFGSSGFGGGSYRLNNDGSDIVGGTTDENPHIFVTIVDGANSSIRIDGNEVASGGVGSTDLDGFGTGRRADDGGFFWGGDIGELVVYNDDIADTGDLTSEEQRLSDKWGISI